MSGVLIHIGFPKAGSTYLQTWFEKHPAFLYRPKAIAGFYDAHGLARYAQKTEKLHEYFVLSSEDLSVWKGDFNVVGFEGKAYNVQQYHLNLTATLQSIFPTAKVLIITRGYSSMLLSLYSQYIKGGGTLTFKELQQHYGQYFGLLYDYNWIIEQYRKTYGADKVIVMPYELFKTDPVKFTNLLEEKLDIQEKFSLGNEKINPSMSGEMITALRRFSKFLYKAVKPLPNNLQQKIYGWHTRQLIYNDHYPLVEWLAKRVKQPEPMQVEEGILKLFAGKADILRHEELFTPYLKEYLI
ncbi:MAG TPA: sulfotransferase [Chitinophagales bacterium]|nr:sulfotransferase [Chitinophagales bacterium]